MMILTTRLTNNMEVRVVMGDLDVKEVKNVKGDLELKEAREVKRTLKVFTR